MNQEGINEQILKRIERLEKVVFGVGKNKNKKKVAQRAKRTDLKTPVTALCNSGFFDSEKTDNDVIKKIREQVLSSTPKRASVSNVLRGLVKRGLLERTGEGNRKNPWKYRKKKS